MDMWSEYQQQSDFINMDRARLDDLHILTEFINNTLFIKDRLFMLRGNANRFSSVLGQNIFSLVFVDGAHDYFSVVDDIISGLKVIEPGGILCGHDYHSDGVDVKKAVHDIIMNSETIAVKGLIGYTSIWYAVIEDPEYELLISCVIKQMVLGDFKSAHEMIMAGIGRVRQTEEIERLRRGLKLELGLQ